MSMGDGVLKLALGFIDISTKIASDSKPKLQQEASWQQLLSLLSICMDCIVRCCIDSFACSGFCVVDIATCSCAQGRADTRNASVACEKNKQIINKKLAIALNKGNLYMRLMNEKPLCFFLTNDITT